MKGRVIRYRPGREPEPKDRTDWDRLRGMTDDEVEAAARSDPDARPMTEEQLARSFRPSDIIRMRKRFSRLMKPRSRKWSRIRWDAG